jgi:biotin carboxyl carrier protein
VDLKRVEELIDLMRRSGVTHLSLELPDYKVSITRAPEEPQLGAPAEQEKQAEQSETQEEAPAQAPSEEVVPVVAPLVGVFHNGGMLDPREIVREGDRVTEGQLLAAIEAMKVPNELRAPVGGVISRLLVEDGCPVQYGQTLFLIKPEEGGNSGEDDIPVGLA